MMPESGLLAFFLVGLLGGVHCAGMCGGIVGALSGAAGRRWDLHLAYNTGRILAYVLAGALAGSLAAAGVSIANQLPLRLLMQCLASLLLILLGVYLIGFYAALSWLERAGAGFWRRIEPYARGFLPARSVWQALPLGFLWGWLPCGLVYSVLVSALVSASASQGAAIMLAFGLGTLPNLLLAGILLGKFLAFVRRPLLRVVAGVVVAGYGFHGLVGVFNGLSRV